MRSRLRACLIIAGLLALAACGAQKAPAAATQAPPPAASPTGSSSAPPAASPSAIAEPAGQARATNLITESAGGGSNNPPYETSLSYPQFDEPTDPSDAAFNTLVQDFVDKAEKDFIATAAPPPDLDPSLLMTSTLGITYSVPLVNNDTISVLFEVSTYNAGAAHPLGSFYSLNYDRNQTAPLELAALFAKDAPYLERIAAFCAKDLAARDALQFPEGAEPKPENFQKWNITEQGLQITFDPYQVAPYAAGPQQVTIPRAELQAILAADSPLKAGK